MLIVPYVFDTHSCRDCWKNGGPGHNQLALVINSDGEVGWAPRSGSILEALCSTGIVGSKSRRSAA